MQIQQHKRYIQINYDNDSKYVTANKEANISLSLYM